MSKTRYCVVGASGRSTNMYVQPIAVDFSDSCELVGIYDTNYGRACYVSEKYGKNAPVYKDFDQMIDTAKPDALIVTCTDYVHSKYIVKGLARGLYVFTEKPMCINAEQVEEILVAEKKYNNKIGVCFNMRYYASVMMVKQMLDEGVIGDIYTANLEWMLARGKTNGSHGASYYRRWNGEMAKSGGLLITKATHHFDMANWFIGQVPQRVSAFGKLRVYGAENAPFQGTRCRDCVHAEKCEFRTVAGQEMKEMFFDQETYDGYIVDKCVFREDVDIYDSMTINVEYDGGCVLSYTEASHAAYEGWKMTLNGSKGRMEIASYDRSSGGLKADEPFDFIRIIDHDNNVTTYPMPVPKPGSHGGSDPALRQVLFGNATPEIPSQKAGALDGAYSVLIGAAANQSIAEGRIITIRDMMKDPSLLNR